MTTTGNLSPAEMRVLLRIVGARPGANGASIQAFIQSHHWPNFTTEQVRDAVTRLIGLGLVEERDSMYYASRELQNAFMDDCRNSSDTIEEFNILQRIIERKCGVAKKMTNDQAPMTKE